MNTSTTLGERIKILRGSLSQRQLAEKLGIPQTTLANYETNKNELSFSMIRMFTKKFGVRTDWLIFGEGSQWASSEQEQEKTAEHATLSETACIRARPAEKNSPETRLLLLVEKLETDLDLERRERRELSLENRQLNRDKAALLQELTELKVQLARLEMSQQDRQGQRENSC